MKTNINNVEFYFSAKCPECGTVDEDFEKDIHCTIEAIQESGWPMCQQCESELDIREECEITEILKMIWKTRITEHHWADTPVNVQEIPWSEVKVGDSVFIAGNLVNNKPTALYGRHRVVDVEKRILKNAKDQTFYERWPTLFMEV